MRMRCSLKDLRILARSPLLVALLVVYPLVVALLIGLSLSRGPDKPRIAFVNEVPPDEQLLRSATRRFDFSCTERRAARARRAGRGRRRAAEAERMVRDGDVAGAR